MNGDNRGPWYLLTGLVLGFVLGLVYAWMVRPVEYVDTSPSSLREDFKERYRALISSAYMANGDIVRARARLELLGDEDVYRMLSEQAQRTLAEGNSPAEAQALGLLAVALGQAPGPGSAATLPQTTVSPSPAATADPETDEFREDTATANPGGMDIISSTTTSLPTGIEVTLAASEPPTRTATITLTPRPSDTSAPPQTPTRTPGAPFVLESQQELCDQERAQPVIQIEALDASRQPVAGIEVIISWEGGEEHFFTGLKPEVGLGYADFNLKPDTPYALRLAEGGQPVSNLQAVSCTRPDGNSSWGALRLTFIQP